MGGIYMSEIITSKNLNEVIKKNDQIREEIRGLKDNFYTNYNSSEAIKAEEKLAFKLLKDRNLIQLPIDDEYWGGAIFVRNGKKIPVINTAQPRVYQYFVAWHEVYHLITNIESNDRLYNINIDMELEERKADYFVAEMLLGNVYNYFIELNEENFVNKIMYCMDLYKAPYKVILINLYEEAIKSKNENLKNLIISNFDNKPKNLIEKFKELELDDDLVKPSNVVSVGNLEKKIKKCIENDVEATSHKSNLDFLIELTQKIKALIGE